MINLLILLPFLKGGTGVSYPVDFLDRYITSSFTSPQKKFGFFFEVPSELRFVSIIYRNFSFESDGRTFFGFSSGTYAEKASLSARGKIIFINKVFKGFAMGLGYLQAPSSFFSIGFYGEGVYHPEGNKTDLFIQTGFSLHNRGFALNIEPTLTVDSLGMKTGLTYIKKLNNGYINSIKIYTGLQIFRKKKFSFGLRFQKDNMKFIIGIYDKKVFAGFVLDFKKRIIIKEIVRTKEVPVYVEVPKKEKKKKKRIVRKPVIKKEKEKEKIPEISQEELEYYYKKGIEFYKMEMLEEAIKAWENIIKVKPDYKDTKKLYEQAKDRLEKLKRISE